MPEVVNPTPGRSIANYRLEERVGGSESSPVYRARDLELDRLVEIELLDPAHLSDRNARAGFEQAARSLAQVEHPAVARLLEAGEEAGHPFLVWEHVSGPSLAQRLRSGPLPSDDVARLGAELAGALEAVHAAGIAVPELAPERIRLAAIGQHQKALAALRKALQLGASLNTRVAIAQVLAASGHPQRARAILKRILATPTHERTASYHLAIAYAHLGDLEQAWRWLDRADRQRSESLNQIAVDPHADPLRKDPRFPALLNRLGLAPKAKR